MVWHTAARRELLLLAAITLIAAIVRFYKLGQWSFWADELSTVQGVRDGFNYSLVRQSLSELLIRAAVTSLGVREWSARLLPAVIGILTIPLLYLPVRQVLGSAAAMVAMLLIAVSPWHLYWSQNARFYVLLLLLYTLALLAFYWGLERDKPTLLVAAVLLLGLAARERLLALFLVPVAASYVVLLVLLRFERPAGLHRRNIALLLIPGLLVVLFLAGPYARNLTGWRDGFGWANNHPLWLLAGVGYYVRPSTVALALAAASWSVVRRQRSGLLLSVSALLPLLTIMALAPFHYTANRYAFIGFTGWVLLAGAAIAALMRGPSPAARRVAGGTLLVLLLDPLAADWLYFHRQNGNRDDWRGAVAVVQAQRRPGDLVVAAQKPLGDFYLGAPTIALPGMDVDALAVKDRRVWLIEDMNVEALQPAVHAWLEQHARLAAIRDVHVHARNFKLRVYLYEPKPAGVHKGVR